MNELELETFVNKVLLHQFLDNGAYKVLKPLGRGGMGIVFLGKQTSPQRSVAIKTINPLYLPNPEAWAAFGQESQAIVEADHPHVLPVFVLKNETLSDGSRLPYLVMKFAEAGSLASALHSNVPWLTTAKIVEILTQVGKALDYIHDKGMLHLDLKPANILLDEAHNAFVADFGLAHFLKRGESQMLGALMGTPAYAPPEQLFPGLQMGRFSDVYALGMMLYELLTGVLPKRELDNKQRTIKNAFEERFLRVNHARIAKQLISVIQKATHDEPRQRYYRAGEFVQAVVEALTEAEKAPVHQAADAVMQLIPGPSAATPLAGLRPKSLTKDELKTVQETLQEVGRYCAENLGLNERELVTYLFRHNGLFTALGYGKPGEDARLEEGHADVVLRAFSGRKIAVLEFKRPGVPIGGSEAQLERYIKLHQPDVGVLCNGYELWIYQRDGLTLLRPPTRIVLQEASLADANLVYEWLGQRTLDFRQLTEYEKVLRSLATHPIAVKGPGEAGGLAFVDRFALKRGTPFGRLVLAMAEVLPEMRHTSLFTRGAYAFWRRLYARELKVKDAPEAWKDLLPVIGDSHEALYHFMFALESAYTAVARLMLARTMESQGFAGLDLAQRIVSNLHQYKEAITGDFLETGYALALNDLFAYMGRQAFSTIFASDIFDWWQTLSKTTYGFSVGSAFAEVILAVFEFNFQPMTGDVLGKLYQSYFDAESRKALGEFYTPPEVVDFILDEVGYTTDTPLLTTRLLDPSCGSGTFLVHALQRYLAAAVNHYSAAEILQKLLGELKIVGFDVNPFAVLMAQINYAAQIIPLVVKALRGRAKIDYIILVLRTDSLRQEYREGEQRELRVGEKAQIELRMEVVQQPNVTLIHTELPVEVAPGKFFQATIPVPRFDTAREKAWINNPEEYFQVLRVMFDAVRDNKADTQQLQERLQNLHLAHAVELATYLYEAANHLTQELTTLREKYDDGRFLKTLADLALALVLKSDVQYDFVVGNPPYIRIQAIPESLREHWSAWYQWAEGNFDAYVPFMERALSVQNPDPEKPTSREWLKAEGRFGFIVSDRFLLANYTGGTRITEESRPVHWGLRWHLPHFAEIDLLVDFRVSTVFENAQNSPAIIIARRHPQADTSDMVSTAAPKAFPAVRFTARLKPEETLQQLPAIKKTIAQVRQTFKPIVTNTFDAFQIDPAALQPKAWLLVPPLERALMTKLEEAATLHKSPPEPYKKHFPRSAKRYPLLVTLEQLTRTQSGAFQGIATGGDDVLIFRIIEDRGGKLFVKPKGADDAQWKGPTEGFEIEREAVRPWVFGRDMERWRINYDDWVVFFPYAPIAALETQGDKEIEVTRLRLMPTKDTAKIFRKKHKYQGEFPCVDEQYPLTWQNYFSKPAIEKRLREREKGRFQDEKEAHLWHGLGRPQNLDFMANIKILDQVQSTSPDFVIDTKGEFCFPAGGTSGIYGVLPVENVGLDFLAALLNSEVMDFYLKHISTVFVGSGSYSYGDQFIKQLPIKLPLTATERKQADAIAQCAQSLTNIKARQRVLEQEQAAFPHPQVHQLKPRPDLYRLRDVGKVVGNLPNSFQRNKAQLQPQLDGQVLVKIGHGSLQLPHAALAEVVVRWLSVQPVKTVAIETLLNLHVPKQERVCLVLLEMLQSYAGEFSRLATALQTEEADLNQKVADYYGLTAAGCSVMNGFLERFTARPRQQ